MSVFITAKNISFYYGEKHPFLLRRKTSVFITAKNISFYYGEKHPFLYDVFIPARF
jgi:hypothetical protein